MLGLEIRVKVSDYVRDRIQSLRASEPEKYQNIACIRSNAMKYLPNFFCKGQVQQCLVGSYVSVQFSSPGHLSVAEANTVTMTVCLCSDGCYCDNRSQLCHNAKHLFHERC